MDRVRWTGRSDVLFALAAAVLNLGVVAFSGPGVLPVPAAVVLAVATGALLLFRRRTPSLVFLVSAVSGLFVFFAAQYLLSLYSAMLYAPDRRRPVLVGAVTLPLAMVLPFLRDSPWAAEESFYVLLVGVLGGTLGCLVRRLVAERAAVQREQAERAAEERRAEERAELAREMHDSVAHQVTLMIMVAAGLEAAHPGAAPLAARIREEGGRALTELRTMIGVLQRHGPRPAALRRLSELSELLCTARRAGLDITVTSSGRAAPMTDEAQHAAYRLVQEALTNAARHAPDASITVELTYRPGGLDVEVRNGAPGRPGPDGGPGSGRGLSGARERIQALGGTLEAGPYEDGFRIRAALPTTGSDDYSE
ncbi:hypothetical protein GCM10010468_61040 [Actinocorallia longicatena]|uniref:histidine kinase n=1 Tax=Actinocorallia longicatena TaxID=111803 RepID=A0ABP6QLF0_9ACTN